MALSSIIFGAVWVMLLGGFTTPFVYATLFSLPMAFLASSVCLVVAVTRARAHTHTRTHKYCERERASAASENES